MYKIRFNQGMLRWRLPKQMLLVMKLTTVIILTCLLQVSAASFGQKVTIIKNGISLSEVFKEIRKQTGYNVLWQPNQVETTKRVNLNIRNQSLPDAMTQITKSNDLEYTIDEETVMIKKKEASFLDKVKDVTLDLFQGQTIDVKGKVVDSLGNGLAGATVSVKNGKGSTSTSANGDFYLKNVEEKNILVVNYLGYITKEVAVNREFNYIKMQQSASKLDEVQVIAYGQTTQRLSVGNVSTLKSDDISKQNVANPLAAMIGRLPGVIITQKTGIPGGAFSIEIRGRNSIGNGNEPLFVIDGVPYSSQFRNELGTRLNGTSQGGSPLSYLNPNDIQSIDVLKVCCFRFLGISGSRLCSAKDSMESLALSCQEES